jgi:hypothetical protein
MVASATSRSGPCRPVALLAGNNGNQESAGNPFKSGHG